MDIRLRCHQNLFVAARAGDVAAVQKAVEDSGGEKATAATQTEAGETALYLAAENGYVAVVKYLAREAEIYDIETAAIRSRLDMDALHVAAKNGHAGVVKELLDLWPGLCKLCDKTNTSPLYSAAIKDHLDVVNAMLDVDESTIWILRKNGKTALHMSARNGLYRIVRVLVERDPAIVSVRDKKGQTALHMAVKGQNTDVVEEMLQVDPSVLNVRDKKGNTALHIATRKWRSQMVHLLLSYESIEVNAVNNQNETAMDLAQKIPYGEAQFEILEYLHEAGAKLASHVGQPDEAQELRRTVSDIKHDVQNQLIQNYKTNKRVSKITKDLKKLHREAVQNTINSVTLVAVLIASIAFMAIFNLPGQYLRDGRDSGKAYIAEMMEFRIFCILNAVALFISLAVVVVQITLVAWETGAQKQVVSVVNKLMWIACVSTCGAFLALAFVVVGKGKKSSWMATTVSVIGGVIVVGTLAIMIYLVCRERFTLGEDSQRRIKKGSGSKSFSWSHYSALSDPDALSDHDKKIYAL